ncbi:hypothetical protein HAX54_029443 [Datura stramonium]|uniref:Ubiquitin-like protease family profile domain-containing protein n=1 Tax=Datura stramonium TaxID=4076 RepID=A0ABS8V991_DATST|nr:hypothetical protein [Datura stramonium]
MMLEAKEAFEVDEDDFSQEQTESGHASKDNEDGEGDDNNNEDGSENYNLKMLMDVHGDLKSDIMEFAMMKRLNCHSPPHVGGAKSATKGEDLFSGLCARDVGKNISSDWIKLFTSYEAFYAYPWGRERFKLIVEYLLRELKSNVKTINLYDFPWAFMAWTFEVIPYLRHQVKDFSEEVSSLRILRWLAMENNKTRVESSVVGTNQIVGGTNQVVVGLVAITPKSLGFVFSIKRSPKDKLRVRRSGALDEKEAPRATILDYHNCCDEVLASYAACDVTRTDDDLHSCGGGYTPLDAGGAGGRYAPAVEKALPRGVPWLGAKRIFTVKTLEKKYFFTLEFLINDGAINVYDCNIPCFPKEEFFLHIQTVMELWPRFLKHSGMFDHLLPKFLNEKWIYEQKKDLPKNEIGATCGTYSLAFIEHLITNSLMNFLCDNTVERMRWRWDVGVVDKELVPQGG